MEIKTVFKVGDRVFFYDLKKQQISEREVIDIKVFVAHDGKASITYGLSENYDGYRERAFERVEVSEESESLYLDKSLLKQDLIKYIESL